jgi:hypothetical protein
MANSYSNNDVATAVRLPLHPAPRNSRASNADPCRTQRYDMYLRRVWGDNVVVPWPFWALCIVSIIAIGACE